MAALGTVVGDIAARIGPDKDPDSHGADPLVAVVVGLPAETVVAVEGVEGVETTVKRYMADLYS